MTVFLYHKRHLVTGLNYFGKTTTDPYRYKGSGRYWRNHLKKHGDQVETVAVWRFEDLAECSAFALKFSDENKIVESSDWANLMPENGLVGGNHPSAQSTEAKEKRKKSLARYLNSGQFKNRNTPESIAKAEAARAAIREQKRAAGIPLKGPDSKPRKPHVFTKPFVNRNTPEAIAKRKATWAKKKAAQKREG